MNVRKSFRCLSEKCGSLAISMRNCPRAYSVMKGERYKLLKIPKPSIQNPNVFLHMSINQSSSQTTTAEQEHIYSGAFPHDPVIFEDIAFDEPVPHEKLVERLQSCKSFAEQMETLTATLALSPEDIKKRRVFVKKIEKLFKPFFTDFKIQIFGSTVNSFGFKGCDIDLTFETSVQHKPINPYELVDVPLVSEVLSGKVSFQEVSELPPKEQIVFIHNILLDFYKETSVPPLFINAHVPLVRFNHDKYKLKCDLTFKNRVAHANTKLLYLFANLDKRVSPLLMALRYWAKHSELIGKGLLFNTYTITLLIIHFLQTRNPPILPSAEYLISLTSSFEIEDMDDQSFLEIRHKIPPSKNTQTLEELFKEFFFFYLYFDFTRVICPMIAASVPREEFFAKETNSKFRMNSICVQDPMCLSHNVAEFVDYKVCKKFFHKLITVCRFFQENMHLPSSGSWGLAAILNKSGSYDEIAENVVSFSLPLLTESGNGKNTSEKAQPQSIAETVGDILKNVLLFQCNIIDSSRIKDILELQDQLALKQKQMLESTTLDLHFKQVIKHHKNKPKKHQEAESMLEQFRKLNSECDLVYSAECKVTKNTWLGREFAVVTPATDSSIFNAERVISEATAEQNKKNVTEKMKPFNFLLECYTPKNNSDTLFVNFRSHQKTFNPILGIFLKQYIPNLIKKIYASN